MNLPTSQTFSVLSRTAILALVNALEESFDATDWAKLGIELDMPQLAYPESRLQKSLRFQDDDYGYQVAQFVTYLESSNPSTLRSLAFRPEIKSWLIANTHSASAEFGLLQQHVAAPPPAPSASEVVIRALRDADHLIQTNGPISAVDRVHTALHGYLKDLCAKENLAVPENPTIGVLLKTIRNDHPALKSLGHHHAHVDGVLGSLAGAVSALNTLRNNASVAHPNQVLLGDPEAMLMVNLVRTLFNYLEARL